MMASISSLIPQFITDHQKLADGVYQTTYEDGTRIIVNYNSSVYSDGQNEIPPMEFIVVKGD